MESEVMVQPERQHLRLGEGGGFGRRVGYEVGEGHAGVPAIAQAVGQLRGKGRGGPRE